MASAFQQDVPASCSLVQQATFSTLKLAGAWTVQDIAPVIATMQAMTKSLHSKVTFSLAGITKLDTAGALLINKTRQILENDNCTVVIENTNERFTVLLNKSQPAIPDNTPGERPDGFQGILYDIGQSLYEKVHYSGLLVGFLGQFLVMLGTLIVHPRRIKWTSLCYFMEQAGVRAVPIVSLLTFLIGLVVAYMGLDELSKFGVKTLAIKLVEVSIFRELGIIITAIVVAGRSSSSFTAQIGSMVSNEEVAAIRSMGLDPIALLVLPRVTSLIITLPMLVFLADVMGILGGAVAICFSADMSLQAYIIQVYEGAKLWNLLVGLIKAPFCALAIGLTGCFQGFRATASAESVGFLTTIAVVQSIFLVIIIDALFAIFFTTLGL